MAILTTALDTEFTPAVGSFNVNVFGAPAVLLRGAATGQPTVRVGEIPAGVGVCVANDVAGTVYRLVGVGPVAPTVRADQ